MIRKEREDNLGNRKALRDKELGRKGRIRPKLMGGGGGLGGGGGGGGGGGTVA